MRRPWVVAVAAVAVVVVAVAAVGGVAAADAVSDGQTNDGASDGQIHDGASESHDGDIVVDGGSPDAVEVGSAPVATRAPPVRTAMRSVPRRGLDPSERDPDAVEVSANATYGVDESVSISVSGVQSRVYAIYLYDGNGTRVEKRTASLRGSTQTFEFGERDAGSYRVVVVDAYTGGQAGATFGVGGAYEAGGLPEVTVDEPADVVSVPVSLPNGTTRTTVTIAADEGAYRASATVVDRDDDGEVVLEWNTYYAGRGPVALRAAGEDAVVDATRDGDLDGYLAEGVYHVTASADGERLDRGAVVVDLEPLLTTRMDVYEAPEMGSPEASLAQGVSSGDVEADEWTFVVVQTQGVFGAVNATDDLRSVGPDHVALMITPEDGGEPVRLTAADYVTIEEGTIVVGFGPGNDELAVDTNYDVKFRITRAHPYRGGDEVTSANLRIVPAGSEPDQPAVSLRSAQAPEHVESGAMLNVTVTLLNHGERTGTVPVSINVGGHSVVRNVTVPGNGQRTVELSFDTSKVLDGNRKYVVEVNGSRKTGFVVIGEIGADDGPTLVSRDEESESALPGFGVGVAVAALLAVVTAASRIRRVRN